MPASRESRKTLSHAARSLRALIVLASLAAGLAGWSAYRSAHEHRLALGPPTKAQERFFADLATRPDALTFFKNLEPHEKRLMAQRLSEHRDPLVVDLIGVLLGDFDIDAREALTAALSRAADRDPGAAARQLSHGGGFQRAAAFSALDSIGQRGVEAAAQALQAPERRAGAGAYLVQAGPRAVPSLLPLLGAADTEIRRAAAEALGKLAAREAVPKLLSLARASQGQDRAAYLAALAGTGDPRSLELLAAAARDLAEPSEARGQAALGLGRIRTREAIQLLWDLREDSAAGVAAAARVGLVLAGEPSLGTDQALEARLDIASDLTGAGADAVVLEALEVPRLRLKALRAAQGRAGLAAQLELRLRAPGFNQDGELVEAAVEALASTEDGRAALRRLRDHPGVEGFVLRQEALAKRSGS